MAVFIGILANPNGRLGRFSLGRTPRSVPAPDPCPYIPTHVVDSRTILHVRVLTNDTSHKRALPTSPAYHQAAPGIDQPRVLVLPTNQYHTSPVQPLSAHQTPQFVADQLLTLVPSVGTTHIAATPSADQTHQKAQEKPGTAHRAGPPTPDDKLAKKVECR